MTEHPPHQIPFVDLGAQFASISDEVRRAIDEVLARGDFILGESVERFEEEMAAYCDVAHAVGVDSGTSALELGLLALGIGDGDEVITVANSFIATALAISHAGATPVLVDMDPMTYQMDVERIEEAITARTRAIMPVHLYGYPADMDPILAIARRHGLKVIEDASQAHGARYRGRRVGGLGDLGAFSLYPAKNLGAYGDAGVLVTDDEALADRLRLLRNYGSKEKYRHELHGFNRRLDSLHAAVLRVKLGHLDRWNEARRRNAAEYRRLLEPLGDGIGLPPSPSTSEPVFHLYVVRHADRDELQAHLKQSGVATQIHYPIPIHLQPAYEGLGLGPGSFPATEASATSILSLPMYPELDDESIRHVCGALEEFASSRERLDVR